MTRKTIPQTMSPLPPFPCRREIFIGIVFLMLTWQAVAAEPSNQVKPPRKPEAPVLPLLEPEGKADLQGVDTRIYQAVQKQARYLLGLVHPWKEDQELRLLTESKSSEHWIRPNTGAVEGFCFLYRFGPYEASITGVTREELLRGTILPMMRYLMTTHVTGTRPTGDARKWGDAWQSAHWAQMLGRGAWWIWDDLPADVQSGVRRVVAHEADRIAGENPPHQLRLDTKAEENAWNSQVLAIAVALLPDDPRRAGWEKTFPKWVISSFLRPADARASTLVDGRSVAEQFTGANVFDDFTLENHRIVHPDYMTCFSLSLSAALDYRLSRRTPPECLLYNVAGLYENLKWFLLPDGGFVYPSGQDWQLFRSADWIRSHVLMAVFARDPDAWSLALRSLETLEKMQARSGIGAVYASDETFFASTQTDLLASLAIAWLTLKAADEIPSAPQDRRGIRRLDGAKIVLHRMPSAIHSFSWGSKVMAQCVPYRLDRIVSPHDANGIGRIRLKAAKGDLPVTVRSAKVASDAESFTAELVLDHGQDAVQADLCFRSSPDGAWTVREKLTALSAVTTAQVRTGLIGILNNPAWVYERGYRDLRIDGQEHRIAALSGKTIQGKPAREIVLDGVLSIHSATPLRFCYLGANRPQRSRATDELYLNFLDEERTWRPGEVISEYEVRMAVGQTAK